MFPSAQSTSRYRQALMRRRRAMAALGIVAAASGCGDGDAAVFDDAQLPPADTTPEITVESNAEITRESTEPVATNAATDTPIDTSNSTSTTADTTTSTAPPIETEPDVVPAAAFPAGGELLVDFTFSPTSTGEVIHNPYIAVWVEDAEGNLVDTVSLWYQTERRGTRWLRTLREWSAITDERVDATSSGATRPAGTYTVAWDGSDAAGQPIEPGTYTLFVEAAREDGPYELSSAAVEFNGATFDIALPNDGELFDLSARLVA